MLFSIIFTMMDNRWALAIEITLTIAKLIFCIQSIFLFVFIQVKRRQESYMNAIQYQNAGIIKEKNLLFMNYVCFNILLFLLYILLHHFLHLSGIMNNIPSLFGMDPRSPCLCLEKWVKYFYSKYMINLYKIFFLAIYGK